MRPSIAEIKLGNSDETFFTATKIIRKRLAKIRRNKSVGPDGFSGEILKLGGETMTPYLSTLCEISLNNATISRDWKTASVVHIYKGGDRSAISDYRLISLNCDVSMQREHVIAGYLRQVWDKDDWLYEGQHGFREGYYVDWLYEGKRGLERATMWIGYTRDGMSLERATMWIGYSRDSMGLERNTHVDWLYEGQHGFREEYYVDWL